MGLVRAGTRDRPPADEATGPETPSPWYVRRRGWLAAAGFAVFAAALFVVYLRLSRTSPENSDQANILLAASDMLHGNLLLHGWYLTDVSFYTTELPQYALLEIFFGVHASTAHIAAARTTMKTTGVSRSACSPWCPTPRQRLGPTRTSWLAPSVS